MLIWVDGKLSSELSLPDRGLDFGDGLFETLLLSQGDIQFPELHLQRLQRGLDTLKFPPCVPLVRRHLALVTAALNNLDWPSRVALRVTVTRGTGPRGYAPPSSPEPRIIISASPLGRQAAGLEAPADLSLATIRWAQQPQLAGIKHLNRLEQVLAAQERLALGGDEIVMLDQQGQVVSVSAGNIFWLKGGCLQTPPLDHCGVLGTRRRLVIERWAPAIGLQVAEAQISAEQLEAADEVFYCNALIGLRPVASFGQRRWRDHEFCQRLYHQACEDGS